jgi:pyruvate/2-oxoglutarate dehydrogenase complex dihydrolipoamide dehydrogenase (E3) component
VTAPNVYDVIVIGAGPAGENAADRVVAAGLSAAIVEAELVGGDCSYYACMPSKALLRPPHALAAARDVDGARESVKDGVDAAAVLRRRDTFVSEWRDAKAIEWLDERGIALVRGRGRLTGARRVTVNDASGAVRELTARQAVVIATGSDAAIPSIPGLAEAKPWTNRKATSALKALGVRVLTNTSAQRVMRRPGVRDVEVTLESGEHIVGDEVLVAAGRRPRTHDIGLETVGLQPGSWLDVDASMAVKHAAAEGAGSWLYAVGDVNNRALLTHIGKYQGRICGDAIAARAHGANSEGLFDTPWADCTATADVCAIPQAIFTEPEIGTVGLTEAQARERGLDVRAIDYDVRRVSGARLYADRYSGHARLVIDVRRLVVVGFTMTGPTATELVHAATIAIVGEIPLDRLWHAVPSFPTIAEVWLRLLEQARASGLRSSRAD